MKSPTKTLLFLCLSIAIVPTSSLADKSGHETAIDNALNTVIQACDNLASSFHSRTAEMLSKKDWTDKEKTEIFVLMHNNTFHSCMMEMAIRVKKHAERIPKPDK